MARPTVLEQATQVSEAWRKKLARKRGYVPERSCCSVCDRKKVCHVCGAQTLLACSDCRLNFGAVVYVCSDPACRDAHERKCWGDGS